MSFGSDRARPGDPAVQAARQLRGMPPAVPAALGLRARPWPAKFEPPKNQPVRPVTSTSCTGCGCCPAARTWWPAAASRCGPAAPAAVAAVTAAAASATASSGGPGVSAPVPRRCSHGACGRGSQLAGPRPAGGLGTLASRGAERGDSVMLTHTSRCTHTSRGARNRLVGFAPGRLARERPARTRSEFHRGRANARTCRQRRPRL